MTSKRVVSVRQIFRIAVCLCTQSYTIFFLLLLLLLLLPNSTCVWLEWNARVNESSVAAKLLATLQLLHVAMGAKKKKKYPEKWTIFVAIPSIFGYFIVTMNHLQSHTHTKRVRTYKWAFGSPEWHIHETNWAVYCTFHAFDSVSTCFPSNGWAGRGIHRLENNLSRDIARAHAGKQINCEFPSIFVKNRSYSTLW